MADSVLNNLHIFTHLFLTITLSHRYHYNCHFTEEEIETQNKCDFM